MELKRFHSDGTKTFKKRSLIMVLKKFHNNGTESLKRFLSDGTKKVP